MRYVCSPSCSSIKQARQEVISPVDQGTGQYEGFTLETCPGGEANLARFFSGSRMSLTTKPVVARSIQSHSHDEEVRIMAISIERIADVKNKLGEGPVWDVAEQVLYWIDGAAPAIYRLDARTSAVKEWKTPKAIGSFAIRQN